MLSGTTKEQRDRLMLGCTVKLVRLSPRRLLDASESLRSVLAATRDGVADALGIDDRDGEEGGLIFWTYEQEKDPEKAVRIELTPIDLPDVDERMERSRSRKGSNYRLPIEGPSTIPQI